MVEGSCSLGRRNYDSKLEGIPFASNYLSMLFLNLLLIVLEQRLAIEMETAAAAEVDLGSFPIALRFSSWNF